MNRYKLSEHLQEKADKIENKRSAKYTATSLLAGAAKLSEKEKHTEIRIPQLCKMCKISRATFYLHFSGKDELMVELMEHLIQLEHHLRPQYDPDHTMADTFRQIIEWYFTLHLSNGNLFLNLNVLRWSDSRISDLWMVRAKKLHAISFGLLSEHKEFHSTDPDYAQYVIELVGSGLNLVVQRVASDETKNPFVPGDSGMLIEYSADLFYRSLFGQQIPNDLTSQR